MEHREPPRIAAGERRFEGAVEDPDGRFRLRRYDPNREGYHVDYGRAGLLTIAAFAVIVGLTYLLAYASRAAVNWLHHQADYQLPFHQIKLATEPPTWYRGGTKAFLERVRRGAGEAERISVLDVGAERVSIAFKKYAWVEEVVKVACQPGRILVDVRYRRPVALVKLPDGRLQIVDDKAVILSPEDVDLDQLGQMVRITGEGISVPSDPRPGVVWKSKAGATGMGEGEPRILAAAKLAGFLRAETRVRDADASPALHILEIIVTDFAYRGLFVMNAEGAEICWGSAGGEEEPGTLSLEQKWALLRRWQQTTRARFLTDGDYWAFTKRGLQHVCPHRDPSHQPREVSQAGKDQPTAARKTEGSG